ncbi:MAG: ketoacyl-synthetase C-terminal extension domain-containing protein, partial [Thermodesulfobacteriota bacterium]
MIEFRVGELAKAIGVHRNTITNWIKSGKLEAFSTVGKKYLASEETMRQLCLGHGLSLSIVEGLGKTASTRSPIAGVSEQKPKEFKSEVSMSTKPIGSVLVVGGGIAGIQATLDLAQSGYYVHLVEKSAGIGGVIKVVLAMRHGWLPAHLHFTAPNPHVPWSDIPLRVTHRGEPWPAGAGRHAGVSSFGFSGTNAHVVLGDAPAPASEAASPSGPVVGRASQPASASATSARDAVLMLSARDPDALSALAERYAARLESGADWYDVCFSVSRTRTRFAHRRAVVANDAAAGA